MEEQLDLAKLLKNSRRRVPNGVLTDEQRKYSAKRNTWAANAAETALKTLYATEYRELYIQAKVLFDEEFGPYPEGNDDAANEEKA